MKKIAYSIFIIVTIGIILIFPSYNFLSKTNQIQHYDIEKSINTSDIIWENNGTALCTETNDQINHQICSDGNGGAIIAWQDNRSGSSWDIYAQKVNSSGAIQWAINGIAVCTANYDQINLQICSDDNGGAFIVWQDYRSNSNWDIYNQRIDSNGNLKFIGGNTAYSRVCTASNDQTNPKLCSDGAGGVIIAWHDYRNGNWDVYAHRIGYIGEKLWQHIADDGIEICTNITSQQNIDLCEVETGGAIIAWDDTRLGDTLIFAQKINGGGMIHWQENGILISHSRFQQQKPKICSDTNGGAFIAWASEFGISGSGMGSGGYIIMQHVSMDGSLNWLGFWGYGKEIYSGDSYTVLTYQITVDGFGGALISFFDDDNNRIGALRTDPNGVIIWSRYPIITAVTGFPQSSCTDGGGGAFIVTSNNLKNIYLQRFNSTGGKKLGSSSILICDADNDQISPKITFDESGGAIIVWQDYRSGTDWDIYVHLFKNDPPSSNDPVPIITSARGSETINWSLTDDAGPGDYRVWINDSISVYLWQDWTKWNNNTFLNIPIDRSGPGIYNYSIEYYDDERCYGVSDNVGVTIIDEQPASNHPQDVITQVGYSEMIIWKLFDDFGEGNYRVLINESMIWVDWTNWINNTHIFIPINTSNSGDFNYTIEFTSNTGQLTNDEVNVKIFDPEDFPGDITPGGEPLSPLLIGAIIGIVSAVSVGIFGTLFFYLKKRKVA